MEKLNQKIKGNNNVQVGVHNGNIVKTDKVVNKTEVVYDPNEHVSDSEALLIRNKIDDLVKMLSSDGSNKANIYPQEYKALYNEFGITSYKTLPKGKLDDAIKFLQKRIAYLGRKILRKSDNTEWRKQFYTSINAKARTLGMNKEELYLYAENVLEMKQPLTSLKDLSDTRLKKLYSKIFNKRG
jgi:hypothetical protein